MSENLMSEGGYVFLEGCTAASNIAAGRMVGVNTASMTIYTYCRETAGFSGTGGGFGMRFIGILDDDISAGQVGVGVWTQGVFELTLASSITTAACIGKPVWGCLSGTGNLVTTEGTGATGAANTMATGMFPVGTVVGIPRGGTSGQTIKVKITPGAFRWGAWNSSTGTEIGNNFPPSL